MLRYIALLAIVAWFLLIVEENAGPASAFILLSVLALGLLGYCAALFREWLFGGDEGEEDEGEEEEETTDWFDLADTGVTTDDMLIPALLHCTRCGNVEVIYVDPATLGAPCPRCKTVNFVSSGRENN